MDDFFEKFSIYDFFNLIGAGLVFLMGLILMGILPLSDLMKFFSDNPDGKWFIMIIVLGISYLIGSCFQQVGNLLFERKYCNSQISAILCKNRSVIGNPLKLQVHRNKAKKLFEQKAIALEGDCFTPDHCNYYYAYCSYYIQNKGNHGKAEKLRSLRGMYALLLICIPLLAVVNLCKIGYCIYFSKSLGCSLIIFCAFAVLFLICIKAYRHNVRIWIRVVLGLYEVCDDVGQPPVST